MLGSFGHGLPAAVYRTSPEGRFLEGNDALVRLLGAQTFEQLAAIDVRDIYVDPSRREWLIEQAAGKPMPVEEFELKRLDGEHRWVRISTHTARADDGSIEYFEGVMEDITMLHEIDEELRSSNQLLDALSRMQRDHMSGAEPGVLFDRLLEQLLSATSSEYGFIAQLLEDDNGQFLRTWAMSDISWNDETRALFALHGPRGMEFHNMDLLFGPVVTTGKPVISNSPSTDPRSSGRPDGHPPLNSFIGVPILKGGAVMGVVALANRKDGYTETIAQYLEPLCTTVGSIIQSTVVSRERTEAQNLQKSREELHHSIVEQAADAIVTFRDGGRIVLANKAAGELMGLSADEIIGQRLCHFIPSDLIRSSFSAAQRALAVGSSVELFVKRHDGSRVPIEATLVRDRQGGTGVTTLIARDVVARKETELALRLARDAAESTARAKDELLASMSHELRTPLNAVIGLSSVLGKQIYGPLTEKQLEYVKQIETSGRHLLSVISTILDLAKAEAQSATLEVADAQPDELVQEVVGLIGELALAKGIALSTDIPHDLPIIEIDRLRARQALLNLLSNAVKFTDEGGRVGIRASSDATTVSITVWDTGIGIAPHHLNAIFEPFEQVDSSLNRRFEGTGLGLALSKRLVEIQGGKLSVASTLGEGSEFTATFVRAKRA
ncbi:PAS domain S-box protein [Salinibacterium sp. SWN1162]|uniref:sensor histidine kinase n=1 Tax=Salinibacterium sp. SWN1162 TaxID=2792053 RepID=UPI0018CD2870|nr:PAS domain S-box protein [Salinibacterium sp. SWN1162]MBH0009618.1 PAS domain S-box protein [Salinibacterium sp. SWN1162]